MLDAEFVLNKKLARQIYAQEMLERVKQNLERSKQDSQVKRVQAWTNYEKNVTEIDKKQKNKLKAKKEELQEYSNKVKTAGTLKKQKEK